MNLPSILCLSGEAFHLKKLVIQIQGIRGKRRPSKHFWQPKYDDGRWKLVHDMSVCLGVSAKLDIISPIGCPENWLWEDNGACLRFEKLTKDGRKQRRQELGWPEPPSR